ncbi:MAG: DUF885 domain-containing protein [Lachnospiraceae bacterium]|nr:DUF885 domain-containing protein [Lachnospiraceae bacterium]
MSGNTLTLHYTVTDPEKYGIAPSKITLGSYDFNISAQKRSLIGKTLTLQTISREQLSKDLQKTYDLLKYSLKTELERLDYTLLEEPLVPSIGIQSQLPILLAEYSFSHEADVINYLTLLGCVPEYFDSLIALEEEKIEAGLFMDNVTANELIIYCEEFLSEKETHFLVETFAERLDSLNLDSQKKTSYITENASVLENSVFPAYEKLKSFLTENQNAGHNSDGLFYSPNGTDYYAWLLRSEIGVDHSFEEIESMLENALKKDAETIAALTKENPDVLSERQNITFDTSNPAALTAYLAKRAEHDFPEIPEVPVEIRDVPKSMEPHLSPAFYLVPPIDNSDENVVYLNNGYLKDNLSFFTTLAHESYPGHLYQTVFENSTDPHPIERLLYFGGYTEGWATYAEQLSYFYAPISEDLASLLSATRSMTLNLYSHLDLYIHAYGWTEEDCSAYLKKFGITNAASIHDMFLLVKQQPANYLKYYLGYLEICNLKEKAQSFLGNDFDLKKFHEFILSYGPAPFELLENSLEDWLKTSN